MPLTFTIGVADKAKCEKWCKENLGSEYSWPHWWRIVRVESYYERRSSSHYLGKCYQVQFFEPSDATLFTLRWQGEVEMEYT